MGCAPTGDLHPEPAVCILSRRAERLARYEGCRSTVPIPERFQMPQHQASARKDVSRIVRVRTIANHAIVGAGDAKVGIDRSDNIAPRSEIRSQIFITQMVLNDLKS